MSNNHFFGPFKPQDWREVIWSITSVFESGRPAGNRKAFQNVDDGIISFGRHQATLAAGSLGQVLDLFFSLSQSPVSLALQQEFGERIRRRDATLRNDSRLKTLLVQSADEPAMAQAQDDVFEKVYYQPAIDHANRVGVHSPLGLACLYDTKVQGGLEIVSNLVADRLGATIIGQIGINGQVDEASWIKTFLEEREARLNRLANIAAAEGRPMQAQALRISVFRVQELRKLAEANNWGLTGRFLVRGLEIMGLTAQQGGSEPAGISNSQFVSFNSPDNLNAVVESDLFTASWRLKNNGTTTWGQGFKVSLINQATGSRQMAAKASFDFTEVASQPTVAPGQEVEITIKMTAPAARSNFYFSDWKLQDPQNNFFGQIFFVRVIVVKKPTNSGTLLNSDSQFVQDLTVQDGSPFPAGTNFEKRWLVKNNGQRKWGSGYRLVFVGGDSAMTGTFSHLVPETQPGEEVVISLPLVAPTTPRPEAYVSTWRIHDDRNIPFGDRLWIKIFVTGSDRPLPTSPLSQHDSRWADFTLGQGPQTIGQFGCLLTGMAMMLNGFGQNLTPLELNQRFLQLPAGQGFNGDIVFFAAPANAFAGVQFEGNFKPFPDTGATFATFEPNLLQKIDQQLANNGAALAQVDRTPATAYNSNVDQHWVLLVARTGDDYLVLDPLDGSQTSLMGKYGRQTNAQNTQEALKNALKSVLFYKTTRGMGLPDSGKVAAGMNINPDDSISNPVDSNLLEGLAWVRFPFKAADKSRSVAASFGEYDPIVTGYANKGIGSLIILNQQTIAGEDAPWRGSGDWNSYATKLAEAAEEIASHYAHLGDKVAYEIWNEGDNPATPWVSVFVPPAQFAIVLQRSATAIRSVSPNSKIVFGGLSTGPVQAADYVRQCRAALNGQLPVDSIGIHPYGRWPEVQPFAGWGFGRLDEQFNVFQTALPDIPLWITEIGIPGGSNPLGMEHYPAIARYLKDTFDLVDGKFSGRVPVIIWFAWSDNMENAGIVKSDGSPKVAIFDIFQTIRDRT